MPDQSTRATLECQYCGAVYRPRPHMIATSRYCSAKCHHAALRERVTRICPVCGASFECVPSAKKQFCSPKCCHTGRRRTSRPAEERFHEKTEKTDGCWIWHGTRNEKGYGQLGISGHMVAAHRYAYELAAGPITDGLHVLHTCDNPSCVRNDDEGTYEVDGVLHPRRGHLWLGTEKDNSDDKIAKGREARGEKSGAVTHPESTPRGERCVRAKLKDADIPVIRQRLAAGELQQSIAESYGVHYMSIGAIKNGKTWKHIP